MISEGDDDDLRWRADLPNGHRWRRINAGRGVSDGPRSRNPPAASLDGIMTVPPPGFFDLDQVNEEMPCGPQAA
jgi:hypothetical protein